MFFLSFPSYSDNTFFIDFSRVLNQSNAGANAQNTLKKKFESENLKFKKKDDEIKKTEADIISQKKVLSSEEYKKKVDELRNQVLTLQKEKQDALNSIAKSRAKAKEELLKSVNTILKK
jgi:Skp family chaperone for outer membrane proteins